MCSCWSMPIRNEKGEAISSSALLFEGGVDVESQIKSIQSLFYHTSIEVDDVSLCIAFT